MPNHTLICSRIEHIEDQCLPVSMPRHHPTVSLALCNVLTMVDPRQRLFLRSKWSQKRTKMSEIATPPIQHRFWLPLTSFLERCLEHSNCVPSRWCGWVGQWIYRQSNEVDVMCMKRKEDAGFIVFVGNIKSLLENRTCTCWMNQEHAPQETVAIMGQLQPMENEDETGNYERARESCTTRMECAKRRKHVLKFFCHTKASIYLSAGKVGMEVTWKGTIPLK